MIHSNKIKIALSGLPENDWWGSGISAYKDNDMMADGATPNQELVCSEHNNLKHAIENLEIETLSIPFTKELEEAEKAFEIYSKNIKETLETKSIIK